MYIAIIGIQPHFYADLCKVINRPDMATDERFEDAVLRGKNKAAFEASLIDALSHKPMKEWVNLLQAVGVPCGPVSCESV